MHDRSLRRCLIFVFAAFLLLPIPDALHAGTPQADLAVDMFVNASVVEVTDALAFTVYLTNLPGSSQTATDVTVTISFPSNPGLAMAGGPSAGSFAFVGGVGVWSLASLAPDETQYIVINLTAPANTYILQAQATATSSVSDPDTANNTDTTNVEIGGSYYTVEPCRLVDSRLAAGPYGGPALAPNTERDVDAAGSTCGIPPWARAVALNTTVINSGAAGYFTLFGDGAAIPGTATLVFGAGQTRTNTTLVGLSNGIFTVLNSSDGTNHVAIDVVGYLTQ